MDEGMKEREILGERRDREGTMERMDKETKGQMDEGTKGRRNEEMKGRGNERTKGRAQGRKGTSERANKHNQWLINWQPVIIPSLPLLFTFISSQCTKRFWLRYRKGGDGKSPITGTYVPGERSWRSFQSIYRDTNSAGYWNTSTCPVPVNETTITSFPDSSSQITDEVYSFHYTG